MGVDRDEELEHLCEECRSEAENSDNICNRCGKKIYDANKFVNPNFDEDKFKQLSEESI